MSGETISKAKAYCAEMKKPGGCQLHNLHCGYPNCNKPPNAEMSEENELGPSLIVNHEEAEQLALLNKEKSNLARCYLDLLGRATPPGTEIVPEGLNLDKLSSALAEVCTYIERHEDLRPYSGLTPGKGLHTEILFFIAAIATHKDRTEKAKP